uniref:NAC domain-containing protein n=1 Tax=Leersia perrieri TaxID=77586 RepID=A0A0D9VEW6_9ORYZ
MVTAAEAHGLSPGYKFEPTDEMLVELYLLPFLYNNGQLPLTGVVFPDDPTQFPPWELLDRHDKGDEGLAYFIIPTPASGRGGRRQVSRSVAGGGKWIKQRRRKAFAWEKYSLSFHRRARGGGSTGWVMHEYAVVGVGATHSLCRVAFTGHGQNRQRVVDGYVVGDVDVDEQMVEYAANGEEEIGYDCVQAVLEQDRNVNAYEQHGQEAVAGSQQFVDQEMGNQDQDYNGYCYYNEQSQQQQEARLVDGGGTVNEDGELAVATPAPARHYNGPVPVLDDAFMENMRARLTAVVLQDKNENLAWMMTIINRGAK